MDRPVLLPLTWRLYVNEMRMGEISKVTFLIFCFIFKTCTERICIENLLETYRFCVCVSFFSFFYFLFFCITKN